MERLQKYLFRPHVWYDSLKEPYRFSVFLVPFIVMCMILPKLVLYGLLGIVMLWRYAYLRRAS